MSEIVGVCSLHPEVPAAAACSRCGTYRCAACLSASTGLCGECRTGPEEPRPRGATLDAAERLTPAWMVVAVLANLFFLSPGIARLVMNFAPELLRYFLLELLSIGLLLGLWKMRKLALYGWSLLGLYSVASSLYYLGTGGLQHLTLSVGLRLLPIVVAIAYWRRMR
ncbi:MAG: hypothetical protein P1V51_24670 [Deltaproteobacteria bacterium]|nr:hypothetical protein [Deltaproteobacteria bacterium]